MNYCVSSNRSSLTEKEDILRKSKALIEGVSLRLELQSFTCYCMKNEDPEGRTKPGF